MPLPGDDPMNKWSLALIVLLIVALGLSSALLGKRGHQATQLADSLALSMVEERARAAGWETRAGEIEDSLTGLMAQGDTALAELARDLDAAHARVASLVSLNAEIRETVVDTVIILTDSSYSGTVEDGLLYGDWRLMTDPLTFQLDYLVQLAAELVHAYGEENRVMVAARALDPRVQLQVQDLVIEPPPPVVIETKEKLDWAGRVIYTAVGVLLGLVLH